MNDLRPGRTDDTCNFCGRRNHKMIDNLLVAATAEAFYVLFNDRGVPYEFRKDEEFRFFRDLWDNADPQERDKVYKQVLPAVRRIASKEPYIFETGGDPLVVRFNFLTRELEKDSFGEMMLERPDIDWRISLSLKSSARVITALPVADRKSTDGDNVINSFNEIDDFGLRIFGVPCSNDYFQDMNEILLTFEPYSTEDWKKNMHDDDFLYGKFITPMLKAVAAEIPRICAVHPEAPERLLNYFYGSIDYYFFNPIEELGITRIGAVNAHGDLGRIPGTGNYYTPRVKLPTELLDVRFATGDYGEISKDTIQLSFDGGWSVCLRLAVEDLDAGKRNFAMIAYLPVTPFGSYRDQVEWDK